MAWEISTNQTSKRPNPARAVPTAMTGPHAAVGRVPLLPSPPPTAPTKPTPTRAAGLLGCKDHTSIRHAVDAYIDKNPKAPRWPDKHRDWNRRIPLGDDGTMQHHS